MNVGIRLVKMFNYCLHLAKNNCISSMCIKLSCQLSVCLSVSRLLVVGRPLATLQTGRQLKTEGKQTGHINVRFG